MPIILHKKTTTGKAFINSEQAKAEMAATIVKHDRAKVAQAQSPIKTRAHIKGFWRQYPKAKMLFGHVLVVWRGSTARRPDHEGYWAAYPYPWWSEKTGLPIATLKRQLNLLEENGLIERTHGHHGGTRTLTFIRPTLLALDLSEARPPDYPHLGVGEAGKNAKAAKEASPITFAAPKPKPQPEEPKPSSLDEVLAILNGKDEASD